MTPPNPTSAEKVADACARLCEENSGNGACERCIAQALTAYADGKLEAAAMKVKLCECEITLDLKLHLMADIRSLKSEGK